MIGRWRWEWSTGDGESGHLGVLFTVDHVEVTASLTRPGLDLVALREPEVPLPRAGSMACRASGLWVDAVEEERHERWTIGLEAFALVVGHPDDTVGFRVPLGFDLEWTRSGPDNEGRSPARVLGEVLVEDATIDVDTCGWWAHWGPPEGHR